MESTAQLSPNVLLFGGDIFDGRDETHPQAVLRDGSKATVRVHIVPQRHLLTLLDLFDLGREAELIERCAEVQDAAGAWKKADPAFIDNLNDESHALLVGEATRLNFTRAVSAAERQIARGTGLLPVKKQLNEQIYTPLKRDLESWISQLMQQLSSASGVKKS